MTIYDKEKKSELILLLQQADASIDRYLDEDDRQTAVIQKLQATIAELNTEIEEKRDRIVSLNKNLKLYQTNLEEAKESITNLKSTNQHLTDDHEQISNLADNRGKMLNDFEMQMEAVKTMISTSLNHYSLNSEVEDSPHWAGFRTIT